MLFSIFRFRHGILQELKEPGRQFQLRAQKSFLKVKFYLYSLANVQKGQRWFQHLAPQAVSSVGEPFWLWAVIFTNEFPVCRINLSVRIRNGLPILMFYNCSVLFALHKLFFHFFKCMVKWQ